MLSLGVRAERTGTNCPSVPDLKTGSASGISWKFAKAAYQLSPVYQLSCAGWTGETYFCILWEIIFPFSLFKLHCCAEFRSRLDGEAGGGFWPAASVMWSRLEVGRQWERGRAGLFCLFFFCAPPRCDPPSWFPASPSPPAARRTWRITVTGTTSVSPNRPGLIQPALWLFL